MIVFVHFDSFRNALPNVYRNDKKSVSPSEKFCGFIKWILRAILLCICVYSVIVFIQRELYNDMFLLVEFKFMDFKESKLKFFIDYIAVFVLFPPSDIISKIALRIFP